MSGTGGFVVGLAFWPGGKEADWGDPTTGIQPCNETQRANLTSLGVHFAAYNTRIDKLSVLKTTFPEQLALTAASAEGAPLVISVVAFRSNVRSEARYVVSGAPAITGGTGFVSTLSLMSKFGEPLPVCNYTQFTYCAASVNFAYDGLDSGGAAFTTASQVRKLNSYSLVSLFAKGKTLFFDFKEKYDSTMTNYWGRFGELQQDVQAAYSGQAEAGRAIGGTL
ncbi:hypothetical protein MNEG_0342 [Monoraphidium neglectum]|uniref:Uncharacterized protein n=1 Tax=Monoraphidium neglectum TaxID=145388 RepID=A0A0D2N5S3_9CHLO|nr:hypothetical protein MNEG_0342 [Monoraphidium neglectum]KIZ07612.1 hypothetical protein MNEG_0342 [Monoraphidium neglectum]|eukprot:XP_013906631.1 hypothetical protein MNEG_0342 [Monoraphidium neglectum]